MVNLLTFFWTQIIESARGILVFIDDQAEALYERLAKNEKENCEDRQLQDEQLAIQLRD